MFSLTISEVVSLMGVTIAGIGVCATLITIGVSLYAIITQRALSKRLESEFKTKFDDMLMKIADDPVKLEQFIEMVVSKEQFKERFLGLMQIEIENILDSRENFKQDKNDDKETKELFQAKELK
ncbi:hypothetical protein DCO58_08355 [Helicobacter saguini]|uniref:Uncharacterized protein n=1 Tax=Helicobacter saguini TaxID=1548018 RepID=A0A347VNR8_9HELI|nr:hypothetical protein [Helicobacter saguini]MWV61664.1 hypothetical protein [Helicobacter saguini]MWV67663.1 hypothetical protein [Helicobacter saguini]MWV70016.1 hypothetical protein [Helicobacter saguini]MWV72771.1 hypothetical protein [Helicobacter saguini]TLD92717.1 hypothetical protein LS64_009850 [Helicobacter saguini]